MFEWITRNCSLARWFVKLTIWAKLSDGNQGMHLLTSVSWALHWLSPTSSQKAAPVIDRILAGYWILHIAWHVREGDRTKLQTTVRGVAVNEDSDSERSSSKRRGVSKLGRKIRKQQCFYWGLLCKRLVFWGGFSFELWEQAHVVCRPTYCSLESEIPPGLPDNVSAPLQAPVATAVKGM